MRRLVLLMFVLCLAVASRVVAEETKPLDLGTLAKDLQVTDKDGNSFRLIMWFPTEYWQEVLRQSPLPQAQKDAIIKAFDDYVVISVIDGTFTPLGQFEGSPASQVRDKVSLVLSDSQTLKPLAMNSLPNDTQILLTNMKPTLSKMLGDMGKSMEIFCFKGNGPDGKRLLAPAESGQFAVQVGDKKYPWRLPLGSVLPPKYDAATGEKFPGNFDFSPFTGAKLTTTEPAKK